MPHICFHCAAAWQCMHTLALLCTSPSFVGFFCKLETEHREAHNLASEDLHTSPSKWLGVSMVTGSDIDTEDSSTNLA